MARYLCSYFFLYVLLAINSNQLDVDPIKFTKKHQDTFESISKMFLGNITEVLQNKVNYRKIDENLSNLNYKATSIDGVKEDDTFVEGLQKIFTEKTKHLENISSEAQKLEEEHTYVKDMEPFYYFNMRKIGKDDSTILSINESFSTTVKVNMTNSFVQVPTNIWAYKNDVLNKVKWTQNLNDKFIKNFDSSKNTLLYQYYGDSSGIFRIYPGNVIGVKDDESHTDLYDCRRRIWYIQASASPKNVVIVIDVSGSMNGNNIGIAKIASSSLIDTLQENDFFNVITINKEVTYVHKCIKFLIQATKENKEMMKRMIQNITKASNIVDVDKGMDEAFTILKGDTNANSTKYTRPTSSCNKAIMFITDGIEGEYAGKESFEKNNKDKSVRAFSFLVGRMKSPNKDALIKMSCENGGYFYSIETLGNVWDTVLGYLKVMSRPISKAYDESKVKPSYTPAYLDSAGLGMIMSVSLSVFNKNKDTKKHADLIGVAGTDIALDNLMDKVPYSRLGIFSHGFVINNNGFILIHPKFRKQEGYLPAPPNILLEDLEYTKNVNKTTQLKESMLLTYGSNTTNETTTYWLYDNNTKVMCVDTSYFYRKVENTDFIAAIALIKNDDKYLEIDSSKAENYTTEIKNGIKALHVPEEKNEYTNETFEYTYVKIAPWDYCSKVEPGLDKPKGIKTYPDASELYEALQSSSKTDLKCNDALYERLLVTAGAVNGATSEWTLNDTIADTLFVATSGGFLKFMTSSNNSELYGRDVLRTDIFENAAANTDADIVASAPAREGKRPTTNEAVFVSFIKSTKVNKVVSGVSGAKLSSEYLNEVLKNVTDESLSECNEGNMVCAIIDHNGFIIASNQLNKYTGRFLGEKLGSLVKELEENVFDKIELNDTQAECTVSDELDSAASFLLTPARLILNTMAVIFKSMYWVLIQLGIFLISLFEHSNQVGAQKPRTIQVSCTKKMTFYRQKDTFKDNYLFGTYKCGQSNPCLHVPYGLSRIYGSDGKKTNMFFIAAHTPAVCSCFSIRSLEHIEIPNKVDWCKNPPQQSFRITPSSCFSLPNATEAGECGGASHTQPSLFFTLFIVIFWTVFRHKLI